MSRMNERIWVQVQPATAPAVSTGLLATQIATPNNGSIGASNAVISSVHPRRDSGRQCLTQAKTGLARGETRTLAMTSSANPGEGAKRGSAASASMSAFDASSLLAQS